MSEKIIAEDYGHMIDLILSADGIRKAFFRNLSIMDVAIEIGEEPEKVMDEIKSIRSVLLRHI